MVPQRVILKLRADKSNFLLLHARSGFFLKEFKKYPQQSVDIEVITSLVFTICKLQLFKKYDRYTCSYKTDCIRFN